MTSDWNLGTTPLVSCLCPTYARPQMLREAIWSFLQQDYPNKELVVVNDHPEPILLDQEYDGVVIHNIPERFPSLGAKRNHVVQVASSDLLLNWDDDDLYLPWRISEAVKRFLAYPHIGFIKPRHAWRSTHNRDYHIGGSPFHGQAAMRRSLFDQIGGYADMNVGEDLEFERRIPARLALRYRAPVSELVYLYRWGNGAHISQFGMDKEGKQSSWDRMEQLAGQAPVGQVVTPGFDRAYWQDLLNDAARNPHVPPDELSLLTQRLEPYHDLGRA